MTQTRFFGRDDFLGTTKWFHYDDVKDDGTFTIETVQDADTLVEVNQYDVNNAPHDRYSEFRHVARIPPMVWQSLVEQGIAGDEKRLRKWLDDRDQRVFRSNTEKLSKVTR